MSETACEAEYDEVKAWQDFLADVEGLPPVPGDHFYLVQRPRAFLTQVIKQFSAIVFN